MVKFGRHVHFFVDNEHELSDLYVVPYNELRRETASSADSFQKKWRKCMDQASSEFDGKMKTLWETIFAQIAHHSDSRGALSTDAIRRYVSTAKPTRVAETLATIKDIHATIAINSEALRKLVKKFDKGASERGAQVLSPSLLPLLYTANFTVGIPMVENLLTLLRQQLHLDDDDGESEHEDYAEWRKTATSRRKSELEWLRSLVKSMETSEIRNIVAHRGFHSPKDRADLRPLENSLASYEAAWTNGIHLCECDVALTKDERLVLAHDEDFSRLALDPCSPASNRKVRDLTFKELISLPLRSGSRPPLLVDVLRSADAIGGDAQLIIEIKPGNSDAVMALARLFKRHPELMERCAVVMSFDAFAMHEMRRALLSLNTQKERGSASHCQTGGGPDEMRTKSEPLKKPKVLLLTVADPPKSSFELWVDVHDFSPVDEWLDMEDGSLDGVYLQFQNEMLTTNGAQHLRRLTELREVGIWGHNGRDPDDYKTLHWLVKTCGVSFVNSDLPTNFANV